MAQARYSSLMQTKELLEQKYLHLSQIVESESTAKWQYSRQCEEMSAEVQKLRHEICLLKRQERRASQLHVVLSKSAAIIESLLGKQVASSAGPASSPATAVAAAPVAAPAAAEARQTNGELPLARARSMDQEQSEHELALRRARRFGLNLSREHREHRDQTPRPKDSLAELLERGHKRISGQQAADLEQLGASLSFDTTIAAWQQHRRRQVVSSPSPPLDKQDETNNKLAQQLDQHQRQVQSLSTDLKLVVQALKADGILLSNCLLEETENQEQIRKIKKVQGFFRGWLCRRRWKQIVQEYIKSPHAESMRKRNNLVFRLVECEEEYVGHLHLLISAFLRPFKMAASSSRPSLSHDELNSIFLNSETLLFLHQIFLKGLMARMESWPTLIMGDLFNMLLPMLTIYQEYVRNHHFSLQVLAECKQREAFWQMLSRLEERPQLNGRTLEIFLIYPMHQVSSLILEQTSYANMELGD